MTPVQRTSPLALLVFAGAGLAAGLLLQVYLSSRGLTPFIPPLPLSLTLFVIAGILLVLGLLLRRAVLRSDGRPVDAFAAVRLLAGARAGQFAGALFAGLGTGLLLQLLTRSVFPAASTWGPMVLVGVAGLVLLVCGAIAEWCCRVPPADPGAESGDEDPEPPASRPSEHPA